MLHYQLDITQKSKMVTLLYFLVRKSFTIWDYRRLQPPLAERYVYNMERTICDMLRNRNQMDIVILADALKRYVKRKDKNIPQLMRYAESFRVTKLIRNYMEVLL